MDSEDHRIGLLVGATTASLVTPQDRGEHLDADAAEAHSEIGCAERFYMGVYVN